MRSVVAAGATAVVGKGAADFWETVLIAPSTLRPDSLAEADVTPVLEEVPADGTYVIADDAITITAHDASANEHAHDMLITVVDADGARLVYVADLYNAGFGLTLVVGGPRGLLRHPSRSRADRRGLQGAEADDRGACARPSPIARGLDRRARWAGNRRRLPMIGRFRFR